MNTFGLNQRGINTFGLVLGEIVAAIIAKKHTGGGIRPPFYRRRIVNQPIAEDLQIDIPEIPFEESAAGVQAEIQRFETARETLALQVEAARLEIHLLGLELELDEALRREILIKDVIEAGKFMDELLEQMVALRQIRKRRQDEEVILAILLGEMDDYNITIH